MTYNPSLIWNAVPGDAAFRLERYIAEALEKTQNPKIFFRADDIAVPSRKFTQMLEIFMRHNTPLCLALVPAWFNKSRWAAIQEIGKNAPDLWCWHQHGWRHANYENFGKKQEFGPSRSDDAIKNDLIKGRDRLEFILKNEFYPAFTPPWNRCSQSTLYWLEKLGYFAVSRSQGAKPYSKLLDFAVNVDLHTRKEADAQIGWQNFWAELTQSLETGLCGVMIHHQRMNHAAFDFLDILLKTLNYHKNLKKVHFKNLNKKQ